MAERADPRADHADAEAFRAVLRLLGVRTLREVESWICEARRLMPATDAPAVTEVPP